VGGIVTSRTGFDGTYNAAYGIDGIFRLFGNDYLNVKVSQVMDDASANKMLSLDPTNIYLNWNRFNDQGLGYNFHYIRSGKDFRPEMGFMNRYNFAHYSGTLQYGWLPGQKSRFFSTQLSLSGEIYSDLSTGETQSSDITLDYDMQTKKQFFTSMGLTLNQENLSDTFSLSDNAAIPAGNYSFLDGNIRINTPGSRRLSARLGFNGGQYYDGFRASFTPSITWNASPTFHFGLNYSFNKVFLPERKQSFTAQVAGLNSLVMFNTKITLSTFIQYNSADKRLTTNVRLRYNPREGNDFYIVFNEGRNMENGLPEPGLPNVNNRLLLLKYTYTFVL
jgi:predicted lactoylglutathione lyase